MSTNKGGTASGSRKAAVSAKDSRVKNDEVLEDLATELYGAVGMALRKSGVNKRAQSRAIAGSGMATKMPTASGAVLRNSQSLASLTTAWKTDPSYRDEEGFPRVLELRGTKGTVEALAR